MSVTFKKVQPAEPGCTGATAGGDKRCHGQLFFAEGSLIYNGLPSVTVYVMYSEMGLMFVYVCIVCVIIPNALLALRAYMDKW